MPGFVGMGSSFLCAFPDSCCSLNRQYHSCARNLGTMCPWETKNTRIKPARWVGGRCRNPRRSGHFLHSPLKLKTLINQCAPQPSTALGIDLTGVLGNEETTDTRTENLGSGGTCTLMVMHHQQLGNSLGLSYAAGQGGRLS